ncbi:hypothetical protein CTAYLR_001772 [Chrysophaeum taylorii]|uniref:Molybdate-anion transporter n=1 Tax=Chrysophaeum taylorii TaxID=2483200 RepID=A0AAD7XJ80_9STRA|nr:hypothetical protein CTAYLR_001772 [Chrysophaeum taylorii]
MRGILLLFAVSSSSSGFAPQSRLARVRGRPAITAVRGGGGGGGDFPSLGLVVPGSSPNALFDSLFVCLAVAGVASKVATRETSSEPASVDQQHLMRRFLPVFWLLRAADWLQGPYFYEVYASKKFNGQPASLEMVSRLFLAGFASTAIAGPGAGRLVDAYGRKLGTIAFCALYSAAALTTRSQSLATLFGGRVVSGVGTSLLFSAPEAWLVGEARRLGASDAALGATFGAAFAGDAVVAILAGQLASAAATVRGPSGPFELSVGFLALGAVAAAGLWRENYGGSAKAEGDAIREAARIALADRRILLVGLVQALFEGAMYVFVLQWPPAISRATNLAFGPDALVPFGKVFSCFMVCCLLGATAFGSLQRQAVPTERATLGMLSAATAAMFAAACSALSSTPASLAALAAAFFAFELCVGLYFPSIGTLRSKYVPDAHRSVIMNLFGIPLNALVISVFLSIKKLGVPGALFVASTALALATAAMAVLDKATHPPRLHDTAPSAAAAAL